MHGSNRRRSSVATPPPVLALRARPADPQKTVVITGSPRGGTSLAASLVAGLGLPFHGTTENDGRARTSPRYEHPGFVGSWKQDRARYAQTAREMDAQFETWAVKHPRAIDDLAAAASAFRNPHFIFMFKEPLSVALRTSGLGGGDAVRIAKGLRKSCDDITQHWTSVSALQHHACWSAMTWRSVIRRGSSTARQVSLVNVIMIATPLRRGYQQTGTSILITRSANVANV